MVKVYEEIIRLGNVSEENGIDFVKRNAPAKAEDIEQWEKSNGAELPKEYKELLLLTNGIRYGMTSIYSLSKVEKDTMEFAGYNVMGEYIGDGSMLLCDDHGTVYTGDHVFGVEQIELKEFLDEWMIRILKDDLTDNEVDF